MVVDALGCCAAGLCVRVVLWHYRERDPPGIPDVSTTKNGQALGDTDKPTSPQAAHAQAHPDSDACRSSETKEQVSQDVEKDAAHSTHAQVHPDSDTCRSNEAKEQVGQDVEEDSAHGTHAQARPGLDACRSNEAKEQGGQDVEEDAAHDSDTLEEQVSQGVEEDAAEERAASTPVPRCDGTFEAFLNSPGSWTAAAQNVLFSAKIVDKSGEFYTIEVGAGNQRTGDVAPLPHVNKMYTDFAALDKKIRSKHPTLPKLPKNSTTGFRKRFSNDFMDNRARQLDTYLSALVATPATVDEPSVQIFLGLASGEW